MTPKAAKAFLDAQAKARPASLTPENVRLENKANLVIIQARKRLSGTCRRCGAPCEGTICDDCLEAIRNFPKGELC